MPSTISRSREKGTKDVKKENWRMLLWNKVPLVPWIAINGRRVSQFRFAECHRVARAVLRTLHINDATPIAREDIELSDDELLNVVNQQVAILRDATASQVVTDVMQWRDDAAWALQQWQDGAFDGHEEDYVAVYQNETKGFGNDPNELRRFWSEKFGIPFQRIIVQYIGAED